MASERFKMLKPKKKKMVLDSIMTCIMNNKLDEVSVLDIANEAEMSRGTFYTYFESKLDAVYTFFSYRISEFFDLFKQIVEENNYEIFKSTRIAFYKLKNHFADPSYFKLLQNVIYVSDIDVLVSYAKELTTNMKQMFDWLYENTDIKSKNVNQPSEVKLLVDLVFDVYGKLLARLAYNVDVQNIDRDFEFLMDVIEKGVS